MLQTAELSGLHGAVAAARAALESRCAEVNDLNVYPVADGDTGTNMLLTVRAGERATAESAGSPPAERLRGLARATLSGARGNSGMILSQLVRGATEALADGDADVARALRAAADAGYRAVREPVEGTMLSVARRMAEGAEELGPADVEAALRAALAAGRAALRETPDQLAVLREAGVVDAGGLGLVLLVEGLATAIVGHSLGEPIRVSAPGPGARAHAPSRYRHCLSFLLSGSERPLDLAVLEAGLAPLGDSLLVMGDEGEAKVHVHTDVPDRALALAGELGTVGGVATEDMRAMERARLARLTGHAGCVALAVCCGAGHRALLEDLGAVAVDHPGELAGALAGLSGEEAVLLVAGPVEAAAAEEAAAVASGAVQVVALDSAIAALGALVGLDATRSADENAAAMARLGSAVATGAVARSELGAGGAEGALLALLERLGAGPGALVTILAGEGLDADALAAAAARALPEAEIEAYAGGQHEPALLVGVE
jgi:DAK2 domain fusion protein YloV